MKSIEKGTGFRESQLRRRKKLAVNVTVGEHQDIKRLSQEWDVSVQKVVWFMVAEYLAKCRKRDMKEAPYSQADLNSIERIRKAMEDGVKEGDEASGIERAGDGAPQEPGDAALSCPKAEELAWVDTD